MTDLTPIMGRHARSDGIPPTVRAGATASAADPRTTGALEALAMRLADGIDHAEDAEALDRLSRRFMEVARMLGWGPQGVSADDRRPVAVLTDLGGPSLRNRS